MTYKSKSFLEWAKRETQYCCICRKKVGSELHHIGMRGIGQKGSDLEVARVCHECHLGKIGVQGKRRIAFERLNRLNVWCDLLEDCNKLLTNYVIYLEKRINE